MPVVGSNCGPSPVSRVTVAVGYGIDFPTEVDLWYTSTSWRTRNDFTYATILWDVTNRFNTGVEIEYRKTNYQSLLNNDEPGTRLLGDNEALVYWFPNPPVFLNATAGTPVPGVSLRSTAG